MKKNKFLFSIIIAGIFSLYQNIVVSQENSPPDIKKIALNMSNPIGPQFNVPFNNKIEVGIGGQYTFRNTLLFQPLIPIKILPKYNLITRITLPFISERYTADPNINNGLGDLQLSLYFSSTESSRILKWGIGPITMLPLSTDGMLFGTRRWWIGPVAAVVSQFEGWTTGIQTYQIWSIGSVNESTLPKNSNFIYIQPFLSYIWQSGAGLELSSDINQNWTYNTTSVFLNPSVSIIGKLGSQYFSVSLGPSIQITSKNTLRSDLVLKTSISLIFPKF